MVNLTVTYVLRLGYR